VNTAPVRTFVGIFPPADVAAAIDRELAPLRAAGHGLKWVRADNLHYTVRFLGGLAPARVEAARRAVLASAAAAPPFRVRLGGPGAFPGPARARILWLGAAEGAAPLTLLAGDIERALVRQGFEPADRPFTPHLTVARAGEPLRRDDPAMKAFLGLAAPALEFEVGEVLLVASTLAPGGSRYAPLERAALGGPAARP
jgi:2'-5' RNA ligase